MNSTYPYTVSFKGEIGGTGYWYVWKMFAEDEAEKIERKFETSPAAHQYAEKLRRAL